MFQYQTVAYEATKIDLSLAIIVTYIAQTLD